MKRACFFFFVCCFIYCDFAFSQEDNKICPDSLRSILKNISHNIGKYDYEQALENSHLLINLSKESNNQYYSAKGYNMLGHVYINLKDSARAKKNYLLGLEYAQESKNDTLLMYSYNNLGNIYSEIPETSQKGIDYYNKVISLAEKLHDPELRLIPKTNIGWTYLDQEKYEKAYPYLEESLGILDSLMAKDPKNSDYNYYYSQLYMLHGKYFAHKKYWDTADFYFKTAIDLAEEDTLIIPASEAYKEYAEMLKAKGDYKLAFGALENFNKYNSKIFEREKLKQMEIANARFNLKEYRRNLQLAKKEQKYQDQIIAKSNEKVVVMVLSSLVLMFILFFLNKINRDRKKLIDELEVKNHQFKEAKEEAEKLSLLKTKFFSTVSHEIRTPLYGVIGLTSLLLEDESISKHKADLRSLKFSADYLLALINDVLQMNKMESNSVKLENVSFHLQDLMNSIVNSFEFTRAQNKNEIHVEIDEQIPPYLIGDPVRLSQVLMNLVGNAVKFTERGTISIRAIQKNLTNEKSTIYFEVEDDGPGIPESKKKVIFEEFSQLNSNNYNYQGTGLGLPIVKKLLKLFGSGIHLKSKEGEGATFSFTITFKIDTSKADQEISDNPSFTDIVNIPGEILIVDDNRINQVVTRRILEKKKFTCDVAGDGETAIEKVKNGNFDLVLMDVNMPGISGTEASLKIRDFNKEIPIVALTAVEVEEIRDEINKAGMNDIIVKPYDVEQFYQIIYRNLVSNNQPEQV
ncbi:hybrid sensor histidine kinase/response regulator [Christiangramia fulva]|uniref:histidine kinase n=1 Tax=Christiangramia fulva TaxID=2126553 RepID=A0A2R3Z6C6_9FLAO|nr:ATP-binding protein [Christiangramia fulva]AVR45772.1 hybrid sensor histidine kinase/response regulator [Christiangramia fulva]